MTTKLKVCTFNLRVRVENDGINVFDNRKPRVIEAIQSEAPDLIGFQEANSDMRAWLTEALAPLGYTVIGCGRQSDYTGESNSIAYRRDRFDLISFDTNWLSATPGVPGSRFGGDQSSCPRIFVSATLKHKDAAAPFLFVNTHLDHKGPMAKLLGTTQILQYISCKGMPFILTGDTNAIPEDLSMTMITAASPCGKPVTDVTATLDGTFHNFGKYAPEQQPKIDYIFTDMPCDPAKSYKLADEGVNGIYISDHYAVFGYVTIA